MEQKSLTADQLLRTLVVKPFDEVASIWKYQGDTWQHRETNTTQKWEIWTRRILSAESIMQVTF